MKPEQITMPITAAPTLSGAAGVVVDIASQQKRVLDFRVGSTAESRGH
jgi:hypothetical protein